MKRCVAHCLLWAVAAVAVAVAASAQTAPDARRSGFWDMSPATQALQQDDALNPAALWLKDGEQRFNADCMGCHGSGHSSDHNASHLRGVATRYPAWDARLGKPITLSARINQCQVRYVKGAAFALESDALLGLEVFVARQSRSMPIAAPDSANDAANNAPLSNAETERLLAPYRAEGERLFRKPLGQLDFSCARCHEQHAGGRLGGSTIPQGHPTGYPIYRLQWQGLGSLQRRMRGCMTGVRAEPFAYGSAELTALELYLMQRAAGMALETPAVRP